MNENSESIIQYLDRVLPQKFQKDNYIYRRTDCLASSEIML